MRSVTCLLPAFDSYLVRKPNPPEPTTTRKKARKCHSLDLPFDSMGFLPALALNLLRFFFVRLACLAS